MNELATVPATPMQLIQAAIDKGFKMEDLGKLFDMEERWEKNRAYEAYAQAMTAAQCEMQPVVRSRENKQQGSMYAALEDIHEVIKPIWLKHRFTLSYGSDLSPYPEHYRITCECLHEGGHATHHFLDGPADEKGIKGNPNKPPIQAAVSTGTYLRRALAVMIFDITIVGADNDGQRMRTAACITSEQVAVVNDWLLNTDTKLDRFLAWVSEEVGSKVESLDRIPITIYAQAIQFFREKDAKARR